MSASFSTSAPFFRELLINFALIYSLLISAFFLPYVLTRALFSQSVLVLYLVCILIYSMGWLYDKRAFFKQEFFS